jgi:hypothetical protein
MRQRDLMTRKAFLALPREQQKQLARQLLGLLYGDLSPYKPSEDKSNTNPSPDDLNDLNPLNTTEKENQP